ncbi:MAG: ADP-glyceromanno-heptose 6-epimerase [Oligoflexia bacterium]|nr:ADP-glyceromanno-heptose 6-epimerase [Oligoflexia bacterium]
MIIITGSAGFIGSQIAKFLFNQGVKDLCLVDKLKAFNTNRYDPEIIKSSKVIEAHKIFLSQLGELQNVEMIIHMGAITNTAEKDPDLLKEWNFEYSKTLWNYCTQKKIPFLYASSAATYGSGTEGFSDAHTAIPKLKPLNLYGKSKHDFDLFALSQIQAPPNWWGLKYFNVYGPHENHKGRMASSVFHGFNEIQKTGQMTLFKSHNKSFKDGEQARDFIYVSDVLDVINFLITARPENGIYNCGTGCASTFLELATVLFKSLEKPLKINWVDTPLEFRAGYQYKTQADVTKLRKAGFSPAFTTLEAGVRSYVAWLKTAKL